MKTVASTALGITDTICGLMDPRRTVFSLLQKHTRQTQLKHDFDKIVLFNIFRVIMTMCALATDCYIQIVPQLDLNFKYNSVHNFISIEHEEETLFITHNTAGNDVTSPRSICIVSFLPYSKLKFVEMMHAVTP